jgi:hypothetical protein
MYPQTAVSTTTQTAFALLSMPVISSDHIHGKRQIDAFSPALIAKILFFLSNLFFLYRSHADITTLTESDLDEELRKVEVALKKILGIKPRLFRPPYGNYNEDSLRVLSNRGYSSKSMTLALISAPSSLIDTFLSIQPSHGRWTPATP